MAAYYYGIELYAVSIALHDGEIDGKIEKIRKEYKNREGGRK